MTPMLKCCQCGRTAARWHPHAQTCAECFELERLSVEALDGEPADLDLVADLLERIRAGGGNPFEWQDVFGIAPDTEEEREFDEAVRGAIERECGEMLQ